MNARGKTLPTIYGHHFLHTSYFHSPDLNLKRHIPNRYEGKVAERRGDDLEILFDGYETEGAYPVPASDVTLLPSDNAQLLQHDHNHGCVCVCVCMRFFLCV
jgi:hypothetical protein